VRPTLRWLALGLGIAGGVWGFLTLADPVVDRTDAGMLILVGSGAAMAVPLWISDGVWELRRSKARVTGWVVLVPLVVVLVQFATGCAAYPRTFLPEESHDPSWFAVAGFASFLVVPLSYGIAVAAILLTLAPIRMIVVNRYAAREGDLRARQGVLVGLLVLPVLPLCISLALITGESSHQAGGPIGAVLLLLGITKAHDPRLLWLARALVVPMVVAGWLIIRLVRRHPELNKRLDQRAP
jgi:hypothetical protein